MSLPETFFKGVTDMLKKATLELPSSPVPLSVSRHDARVRPGSAGIAGSPQTQGSDEFVV